MTYQDQLEDNLRSEENARHDYPREAFAGLGDDYNCQEDIDAEEAFAAEFDEAQKAPARAPDEDFPF